MQNRVHNHFSRFIPDIGRYKYLHNRIEQRQA